MQHTLIDVSNTQSHEPSRLLHKELRDQRPMRCTLQNVVIFRNKPVGDLGRRVGKGISFVARACPCLPSLNQTILVESNLLKLETRLLCG